VKAWWGQKSVTGSCLVYGWHRHDDEESEEEQHHDDAITSHGATGLKPTLLDIIATGGDDVVLYLGEYVVGIVKPIQPSVLPGAC